MDRDAFDRQLKHRKAEIVRHNGSLDEMWDCVVRFEHDRKWLKARLSELRQRLESHEKLKTWVAYIDSRTKTPCRVADKLARLAIGEKKQKPRLVTNATLYNGPDKEPQGITDLIGLRLISRQKSDWEAIHDYLTKQVFPHGLRQTEARYRPGTSKDELKKYKRRDIHPVESEDGYTALHYIFRLNTRRRDPRELFFEIQVRTIFEDGWAQISHQVDYSVRAHEVIKSQLDILNHASNMADQILAQINILKSSPRFISWQKYFELERQAEQVLCLTPQLDWDAKNMREFRRQIREATGKFDYFVLGNINRRRASINARKIQRAFRDNSDVNVHELYKIGYFEAKMPYPVITDVLLLTKTSYSPPDIVVIGAPASAAERFDMLITESGAVSMITKFFTWARALVSGDVVSKAAVLKRNR
jgi:ppGpp synthetase/RelA/SpoT-type nucleotidyltranferase